MHRFKKQLGQNFLRNEEILDKIANAFNADDGTIIEVGPGDGALTKKLVTKGLPLIAFEIDESLEKYLSSINSSNLKIIYKDFLNVNLKDYISSGEHIHVVSNVPYYITTPIITKFIDQNIIPDTMIIMVQKEVAERLSSNPGSSNYGAISVLLNYFFDIEYLFDVDRNNFYPIPNVDSAVIKFVKKDKRVILNNYEKFKEIVKESFKMKRKTLKNNLKRYNLEKIESILLKYSYTLDNRAEEIDYKVFVDIANNI